MSTFFTAVMTVESFVTFYSTQIDDDREMLVLKTVLPSPAHALTTAYQKDFLLSYINLEKIKTKSVIYVLVM